MSEFRCLTTVRASADDVFSFVCDPSNMPQYLPTMHEAVVQDEDRVEIRGESAGGLYDADGWFDANWDARRMEWGSDGESQYQGWLQVTGDERSCQVTVFLEFQTDPGVSGPLEDRNKAIDESLRNALKSIKSICEGSPIAQAANIQGKAYLD